MQASASGVLEEVKRKKTDLKSLLDLAETLRELRTLRREASRKKGESDSYRFFFIPVASLNSISLLYLYHACQVTLILGV